MLVSTSGVTVTKHFCGERLASVSVLGDGGCSCASMAADDNCCHTERDLYQVDDDFSVAPIRSLNLAAVPVIAIITYRLSLEFNPESGQTAYLNYRPPLPDKDIPVLIQSFLI